MKHEPVFCQYKTKDGKLCPCGNKEIPSNEVQRRRLFGIDNYPVPYCILALSIMRAEEAEFDKKYRYTRRKGLKE